MGRTKMICKCGKTLCSRNKSGLCNSCRPLAHWEALRGATPGDKKCVHCGEMFSRPAWCPPPKWRARRYCSRGCGARANANDPAYRRACGDGLRERLATDPAAKARHAAAARQNIVKAQASADRSKSGATRSRNVRAGIPDWTEYKRLRCEVGAAEARRMIVEEQRIKAARSVRQSQQDMRDRQKRDEAQRY